MNILVVDDEPPARARLLRMLAELGHHDVREASDAATARAALAERAADVVLLDVSMPGIDGLSFAAMARLPAVVFVTGDPSHAARAFDVEAADFVTKPVRRDRLMRALERAARLAVVPSEGDASVRLRVIDGQSERFVDGRTIDVFRAEAKCVVFDRAGKEEVLRASLDELEAQLEASHVRVHRGFLVRLAAITELRGGDDGATLLTTSGTSIPVARRALGALRALLKARVAVAG